MFFMYWKNYQYSFFFFGAIMIIGGITIENIMPYVNEIKLIKIEACIADMHFRHNNETHFQNCVNSDIKDIEQIQMVNAYTTIMYSMGGVFIGLGFQKSKKEVRFLKLNKIDKAIIRYFQWNNKKFTVSPHSFADIARETTLDIDTVKKSIIKLQEKKLIMKMEITTEENEITRREYVLTIDGQHYQFIKKWEATVILLASISAIATIVTLILEILKK